METLKFKTNINCSGCVAKVTPFLNESAGVGNWQVDTSNSQKTLTVNAQTASRPVIESVKAAGFQIEKL